MDELRAAYRLHQHQFRVVDWEPAGLNGNKGEYLVRGPSSVGTFVEVTGPRWEGELDDEEIKAGRTKQPKELYLEGRAVAELAESPERRAKTSGDIGGKARITTR